MCMIRVVERGGWKNFKIYNRTSIILALPLAVSDATEGGEVHAVSLSFLQEHSLKRKEIF